VGVKISGAPVVKYHGARHACHEASAKENIRGKTAVLLLVRSSRCGSQKATAACRLELINIDADSE
jgi:hypothetical protein